MRGVSASLWSHPITLERQSLGRLKTCGIQIVHDTVSREHAEVWCEADGIHFKDLGSSNGSFVNDDRVNSATVQIGDTLRLGEVALDVSDSNFVEASSVYIERKPTKLSAPGKPVDFDGAMNGVSAAQHRVLRLLLTGKSEKEVAEGLHVSPHTVHSHVKQLYRHFCVSSRAELMAYFIDFAVK